ncbi:hypothetical protein B4135_3564 [Caldibacillus debilis]|uniref:Uncharacterized protein n=1 Tax=Caldibacillus debilis TaxID=301148 RepID=A0A150LEF4_9BACI|nr:hypothetical protein B4135_3564 [Caldibacillus debilis]
MGFGWRSKTVRTSGYEFGCGEGRPKRSQGDLLFRFRNITSSCPCGLGRSKGDGSG